MGQDAAERAASTKGQQIPSVGRVVHYVAYGTPGGEFPAGVCRAAIITEVHNPGNLDSVLSVCVFNPTGQFFNVGIYHDEDTKAPGTWHWPEFVPSVPVDRG